jgi:hypothetical protein
MSEFLRKNVEIIRAGLDDHNGSCPVRASAILFHPTEHEKLKVPELWGLPVLADDRVRLGYFRVDCEGSAWDIEKALALHIHGPVELPVTSPADPVEHPLAAQAGHGSPQSS